jgi:hypothetical protein
MKTFTAVRVSKWEGGAGDPERAARLTVLPLNARDAGDTHRLYSRAWHAASKKNIQQPEKPLEFVGRTRVPSRIHCISVASVCCTCSLMGLRTSDNRRKRELLSLQKHMNCRDAVTSVNCFRLLFEAPESRCRQSQEKTIFDQLAVRPAVNAKHKPQPKCRCKIAKISANADCTAAYADCIAGNSAALRSIGLPAIMAFV